MKKLLLALILSAPAMASIYCSEVKATVSFASVPPATLKTDQVFAMSFNVTNNSSIQWHNSAEVKISTGDMVLGTPAVVGLQGKGSILLPGETKVWPSNFRAPRLPGVYNISAFLPMCGNGNVVSKPTDIVIGPGTASITITVTQGTETPIPHEIRPGKFGMADFTYLGSFKLPKDILIGTAKEGNSFTASAITLRKGRGSSPATMFSNYGLGHHSLVEFNIPALGNTTDPELLPEAVVSHVWGNSVYAGKNINEGVSGIYFDSDKSQLYFGTLNGYWAGPPLPVMGLTTLNSDGTSTYVGNYYTSDTQYKGFWGGVMKMGSSFAAKNLPGMTVAAGFGGYYSIVDTASIGPALAPFSPSSSSFKTLLKYVGVLNGVVRPGDYFLDHIWGAQPKDYGAGTLAPADRVTTGFWTELNGKEGIVYFSNQSNGWIEYLYGGISSIGRKNRMYFYDPQDLLPVIAGTAAPTSVQPYSVEENTLLPYGGDVTGVAVDEQAGKVYIYADQAYKNSLDYYPVVSVYGLARGTALTKEIKK